MDFKILSKYDDLCASLFLDDQYLWFDTIKMNDDQVRPDTPFHVIQQIIFDNVIVKRKVSHAAKELLSLPFFDLYLEGKDDKERLEFLAHVKRYLLMYIPHAGFEISDTNRYSGIEACVISTKTWEIADEIRNCTGMIACLTPEDDAELKNSNRDFSIMYSQRRNSNCLFLGPARFMNHDCGANCRFIGLGPNGITFKVVKKIKVGEELTVFYGPHYFGADNCECRCLTCENEGRGYFASSSPKDKVPPPETVMNETSRRSGRKKRSRVYEEYVLNAGDRRVRLSTDTDSTSQKKARRNGSKRQPVKDDSPVPTSSEPALTPSTTASSSQSSVCTDVSNGGYRQRTNGATKGSLKETSIKDDLRLDTAMKDNLLNADMAGENKPTIYTPNEQISTTAKAQVDDRPAWLQVMDDFLDDGSDVSSVASDDLEVIEDSMTDFCIACERSLYSDSVQHYTRSCRSNASQQYQQLRHHAQTRCWRCSRHYLIYHLEWPTRWAKK